VGKYKEQAEEEEADKKGRKVEAQAKNTEVEARTDGHSEK
jgi:hypothetical protein